MGCLPRTTQQGSEAAPETVEPSEAPVMAAEPTGDKVGVCQNGEGEGPEYL